MVPRDRQPTSVTELAWTEECLPPDCQGEKLYEYIHRYAAAAAFCRGKVVVDVASGVGYGSSLLAGHATQVTGVEISPNSVDGVEQRYQNDNLKFLQGDCGKIPLPNRSCDVVVSFETIAHAADFEQFLSEIKRILRPKGLLVMSAPDKESPEPATVEPGSGQSGSIDRAEFQRLLKKHFSNTDLHGQRYVEGSVIDSASPKGILDRRANFGIIDIDDLSVSKERLECPACLIALASDSRLPAMPPTLLTSSTHQPLQARLLQIEKERNSTASRLTAAETALAEFRKQLDTAEEIQEDDADRLALLSAQRDGVAARLSEAEKALADLQARLDKERGDFQAELAREREDAARRIAQAEEQRDGVAGRLIAAAKERDDLQAQLAGDREDAAQRLAQVVTQRDDVAAQLSAGEKKREDADRRLAQAEEQRATAAARLSETEKALAALQDRLGKEREDAAQRLAQTEEQRDGIAGHLIAAEKERDDLQAQLAGEREEAAQRIAQVMAQRDNVATRLSAVEKERDLALRRLAQAEEQRDGVAGQLAAAEKEHDSLRTELAREREDAAQRIAQLMTQRDNVATRLNAAEKERDGFQARLEKERDAAAQRLAQTEEQRAIAAGRMAAMEKAHAALQDQLEQARTAAAKRLAEVEEQRAITAGRLTATEKERDRLKTELAREREDGARRLAQAEEQRNAIATRLNTAEKERDGLQARLETDREDAAQRLAQIEEQRNGVAGHLIAAEKERDDLRAELAQEREDAARCLAQVEEQRDGVAGHLIAAEKERDDLRAELAQEREDAARRLAQVEEQRDGVAGQLLEAEQSGRQFRARMESSLNEARQEILRLQVERDTLIRRLLDSEQAQAEAVRNSDKALASRAELEGRFDSLRTATLARMRRSLALGRADGRGTDALIKRTVDTVKATTLLATSSDLFDPAFYLAHESDVAAAGHDPRAHYLSDGWMEGRTPNPVFRSFLPPIGKTDRNAAAVRRLFDATYYYAVNADVRSAGVDAYEHFCLAGWKENRSPNPLFSPEAYFAANPDVRAADLNPLVHYALIGWHEGRDIGGIFDGRYYLDAHPDVRDAGVNPLEHFVFTGIAKGYRPNRTIDPAAFLSAADMRLDPWQRVALLVTRMEDAAKAAGPIRLPVDRAPQLSVIVYARDNASSVLSCLASLERTAPPMPFEVLLLDHGSRDLLAMMAGQWSAVRYIRCDSALPWQEAVNQTAVQARGDVLVLADGNVEFTQWWASELLGTLHRESRAGVVGGQLFDVSGRLGHAGGLAWRDGSLTNRGAGGDGAHPRYNNARPVDYVSPSLMAVRTDLFLEVGGFDSDFSSPDYVAADFGRKVWQQGSSVFYQPLARAVRFGGDAGQGAPDERERFRTKWATALDALPERPEREGMDLRGVVGHAVVIDHITPTPDADAGSVIQWHLIDLLLRMGWAVSFVPEVNMENRPRYTADLQRIGVHCVYAPYYQNLYEFLRDEGRTIDLAIPHRAPSAAHYLDLIRTHSPNARVLLNTCDIHYIREMRGAEVAQSPEMMEQAQSTKRYELDAIQRSDCTIVVSLYEEQIIAQELPDASLTILPLIMDAHGPQAPLEELRDLCFIGGYRHMPNADAVHYFVREVWPLVRERLPDARFRIMGSHVPPDIQALEGNGVVVDGFVPDLATSLARCRVSVAPLRFGAGIKGKVGSSLSYGIPCVASSIASEGMGLGPCDGVEVADDPADIADRIVHLYTDDDHWRRMSKAGLEFVHREYSLQTTANRLARILGTLNLPAGRDPFA